MKLTLENDSIIYKKEEEILFQIDINKLFYIGEYTTDAGPLLDDWFLVFSDNINDWREVSVNYFEKEFFVQLGEKLNCKLNIGLANSTNWNSRIIYPKELEGKELFDFKSMPTEGFINKIFKIETFEFELSDTIKKYFLK